MALIALTAAFVLLVLPAPTTAQDQDPASVIRTRLSPDGNVVVGEPVRLTVDLLVPNYFMGAPAWPDVLDVADAIATRDDSVRANFTERIDAVTYAGQTRGYVIYAQAPGSISIPAIEVSVRYASDSGQPLDRVVTTSPVSFESAVPPGAAGLLYFFSTTSFQITERFDRPFEELKVGDAVVRTVTMRAVNSAAILLPPVTFEAADGVSVYQNAPRLSDRGGERGSDRVNERVEQATYVFEREGAAAWPAVTVSWWDPEVGRVRTATLPERNLSIAPNPDAAPEIELALEPPPVPPEGTFVDTARDWWRPLAVGSIVLVVLRTLVGRYWKPARQAFDRWRADRTESEAAYFERVRRASLANDPRAAYQATVAWLDRADLSLAAPTLDALARASLSATLPEEQRRLMAHLYGSQKDAWSGRRFYDALQEARSANRAGLSARGGGGSALPGLNP
jgi:hypothetical protein